MTRVIIISGFFRITVSNLVKYILNSKRDPCTDLLIRDYIILIFKK